MKKVFIPLDKKYLMKFTPRKRDYSTGFTLVELLVVIAVIGILATLVLLSVAGGRAKSVDAQVRKEMAGLQQVISQCASDDGIPAIINDSSSTAVGDNICDLVEVSVTWPDLTVLGKGTSGSLWDWDATTTDYDSATGAFSYSASSGTNTFTCDQNGCQ